MQISIQKILIRHELNYKFENSLHQSIVSSLYASTSILGEAKLD